MEKEALFYLLCIAFLLLPITSATPILNFQHEDIQPGETIIATINTSGEFSKQIEPSDIEFYQGRKRVSLESGIAFYNETYYLYVYTNNEGEFIIKIPDILYTQSGELKSKTIQKNFTVIENPTTTNETTSTILSIKPGFVFTTEVPKLKLTNKGTELIEISYLENGFQLQPSSSDEIEITPATTLSHLRISTYKEFSIPIIYLSANTTFQPPTAKHDLRQSPETLVAELFTDTTTEETIQLFNFGDTNITNIKAESQLDFIKPQDIEDMLPRGVQNITLTLSPEISGHFEEPLNISYTQNEIQKSLIVQLSLFVLPKGSPPEDFDILNKSCEELQGKFCESNEECIGKSNFVKNREQCCLGNCEEKEVAPEDPGSYGWIIGVIIIIALGGAGYYFYKKQKKVGIVKPEEKLKETTKKFEKKFESKTKRVVGNLSKN